MREPPDTRPLDTATWRTSSYSTPNNNCVEIARPASGVVGLRDSKAPDAGWLVVAPATFEALLDVAKH